MDVERGPAPVAWLLDDVSQQPQRIGEAGGEGVLERERRGLPLNGPGQIGGQETFDDDGWNLSLTRVGQAVTAFDLGEEALRDEHALLFQGR